MKSKPRQPKTARNHRDSFTLADATDNDVATIAAAVAAATASQEEDEDHSASNATANLDWEALSEEAHGIVGPGEEEEEEMGAQALLELGNATKQKKKKRKGKKSKKKQETEAVADADDIVTEAIADPEVDEIAPELRDVDKHLSQLGSLDPEYGSNVTVLDNLQKDDSKKKRKRSNTFTSSSAIPVSTAPAANNTSTSQSSFDFQEFFNTPDNPNWQRFYDDAIPDDSVSQVDLNMLIEEQAQVNAQNSKNSKRQKRSSNVDPALEQLDETSPLEMTTKEQSQLEDAMMHASAIVRTLESGGNQHQFDNDSILINQSDKDAKKKRKTGQQSQGYSDELLNEAIKFARTSQDLSFDTHDEQQHPSNAISNFSQAQLSSKQRRRPNIPQGDLTAISLAKDPALLNPLRRGGGSSRGPEDSASVASSTKESPGSKNVRAMVDPINNNWRYVSLPGENGEGPNGDDLDASKRITWTGDGTEHGGNFSQEEVDMINNFMAQYCARNRMTRDQLCQRVWSNERRKDNFWDDVANILPSRTRASVYKHIRRAYHVFAARGKWTPNEDKELGQLVEEKGKQWKQIGVLLGRMPEDCRDRWRNYVKCGEKRIQNKWGVDEEDRLRGVVTQLLASFPGQDINWTEVSELMGGTRSRIQCRYKWTKLTKRAAMAKIDAMMPGDKISLLQFLKDSGYEEESQVDWDGFAALDSRGFWSGKELQEAFERLKSTLLDAAAKPFRQIVIGLLNDLLLLPEHRRREKFRGPNTVPVIGNEVNTVHHGRLQQEQQQQTQTQSQPESPQQLPKRIHKQQEPGQNGKISEIPQAGDPLELTDDLVAVAAAAAAAMQETQTNASNSSGLGGVDRSEKGSKKKKHGNSSGALGATTNDATTNAESAENDLDSFRGSQVKPSTIGKSGSATKKNTDFYGTPPTASVYQQHRQQQQVQQQQQQQQQTHKRNQQRNWYN